MIAALLGLMLLAAPIVSTSEGAVSGVTETDGSISFLGIPYARPPIGPLRWKPPQPIRWTGVRPADTPGRSCPQNDYGDWNRKDALNGSEDCLTLELRTPSLRPPQPLPVMVWIHGGGNRGGSGIGSIRSSLVSRGVVLVDLNYRLGVLGFLSHPALSAESPAHSSGNYGLMDQQAALRWVKSNIARFGGDPDRITIFGESAGGEDVGLQTLIPSSRGLFARAIEQSGSPGFGVDARGLGSAEVLGERIVRLAGAPPQPDATTLRRLPVAALLRAGDAVHVPELGDDSFVWLQVTVDGEFIPRSPARLLAEGHSFVPLIIGTNMHEFAPLDFKGDVRAVIHGRLAGRASGAMRSYGLDTAAPATNAKVLDVASDLIFACPAEATALARYHAAALTWVYRFDHAGADGEPVAHGSKISSVMKAGAGGAAPMQDFWISFARTGDPNGPGLPRWPRYEYRQPFVMYFRQARATAQRHPSAICAAAHAY